MVSQLVTSVHVGGVVEIMVFLLGTAIMHKSAVGRPREEWVKQAIDGDVFLRDFGSYVPADGAVNKLRAWRDQGASIVYLSSHTEAARVELDKRVLSEHGFPMGSVYFRSNGRSYHEVVEAVLPDVLIEDDCESIGGEREMTYPHLKREARARVKSIVVKEFGGLHHLPDDPALLLAAPG
jgi:hypothetical protein